MSSKKDTTTKTWREKFKVHPVADRFPMMSDEEVQSLADDIKENGLKFPIVRDSDGQIIDGRNRLRACELAGIEPTFTELDGQDPIGFIVSANLARRNLSKGQQAMLLAIVHPEPEERKRGKDGKLLPGKETLHGTGFSRMRLSQARTIQHYSTELADAVVAGTLSLDEALAATKEQQAKASSAKALAEQVTNEKLTLIPGALSDNECKAALESAFARRLTMTNDDYQRFLEQITTNPNSVSGEQLFDASRRMSDAQFYGFQHATTRKGKRGDAFAVFGKARTLARKAGWTTEKWKDFLDEATSGNFPLLLRVCTRHFNVRL